VTRLLKFALFAAAFLAALMVGHHNANAALYRSHALEAKLPTAVTVFCTDNTNLSYAMIWQREIYLDSNTCAALTGAESHISVERAAHTLYHEWWHVAFRETNEKFTECGTYATFRYMLRTFWGRSARDAERLYRFTTTWSPYSPLGCVL
jgi:hypothetical protein